MPDISEIAYHVYSICIWELFKKSNSPFILFSNLAKRKLGTFDRSTTKSTFIQKLRREKFLRSESECQ